MLLSLALDSPVKEFGEVTTPVDIGALFFGGAIGAGAVGALGAVASGMGNLGAYILVARAVSMASALGVPFAFSGGTAGIISFVAAMGGPLTVAASIVALSALTGLGLFGESWQRRLARRIVKELSEKGVKSRYRSALKKYWDDTRAGIDAGFERIVESDKARYEELKQFVSGGARSRAVFERRVKALEEAFRFFDELPWLPMGVKAIAGV